MKWVIRVCRGRQSSKVGDVDESSNEDDGVDFFLVGILDVGSPNFGVSLVFSAVDSWAMWMDTFPSHCNHIIWSVAWQETFPGVFMLPIR